MNKWTTSLLWVLEFFPMNLDENVIRLEKKINFILPQSYKYFLSRQHTSKPLSSLYVIPSHLLTPLKIIKVSHFFHIGSSDNFSVFEIIKKYPDFLRKALLPIAYDKFYNLIILNLIDKKIYVREMKEKKMYLIAENFEDFFDKLY